jgi:hypothetical protein
VTTAATTLRALNRATLARQRLLDRRSAKPAEALAQLVALQAQVPRPPFVGLWSRVSGFTREALVTAIRRRTIVRATTLRGTIHLMTARDYLRFRSCLQPGLDDVLKGILRARLSGIDVEALERIGRAFFETPRTFDELRAHLTATGVPDVRAAAYTIRLRVPLLQVPDPAPWAYPAQAGFQTASAYLGEEPAPCGGLETLVTRYLAAHGPSTARDLAAWAGMRDLTATLEAMRPALVTLKGPGRSELFDLPDAPRPDPDAPAPIRFVPEYDNLIVARSDERVLPRAFRSAVFLPALRVAATVLVDGVVAATWTTARARDRATLAIRPLAPVPRPARAEMQAEGASLLRFLEPDARTFDVRLES